MWAFIYTNSRALRSLEGQKASPNPRFYEDNGADGDDIEDQEETDGLNRGHTAELRKLKGQRLYWTTVGPKSDEFFLPHLKIEPTRHRHHGIKMHQNWAKFIY